ncbi:hypothetical protein HD554DRAFT_2026367, partial [Boletus coccyginus]
AQHMKMCKPEDDIALSDGLTYMVANRPYENHVSKVADNEKICNICCRSSYQNHKAVNNANTSKSHLCATEVGATTCIHHGCFVPHSVAVSYKSQGIQKTMIIYDMTYQWHKNFFTRINKSPTLSWPGEMEIMPAIGKFHLSAHKPHYFLVFSLISITLVHYQKLYDNHMRDSNWKKLVGLGESTLMKNMIS